MADLSVNVALGYGRTQIMGAPAPVLTPGSNLGETFKLAEALTARRTLSAVVGAEALSVVANSVSRILDFPSSGEVAFVASPNHATVTSYTARVRVSGVATVVATQSLGVPTPDGNNTIIVDLTATFAGLAAGDYTVSILVTSPGGSTDSQESSAFTLPLP